LRRRSTTISARCRASHQLAHDLLFRLPGARASLSRYGTVPASPESMASALERGAALLVYPGGDHETYRPSWESAKVDFAGRTGFVRLAIEHGVPIVPVVAIGGQETALFLGQGRGIAKLVRLDSLARLKVFPAQVAPPFGLTVLDLPGRIPLPSKIVVRVLPKVDLKGRDPDDAYERVTGAMQRALHKLDDERSIPVVG
jgi:1-acyl-sn-glycerol-3-phosphate acyltransferase